jgi:hypothetical protein
MLHIHQPCLKALRTNTPFLSCVSTLGLKPLGGYSRQNGVSALRAFNTGWVHLVHEAVWILSLTHAGGKEVIYMEWATEGRVRDVWCCTAFWKKLLKSLEGWGLKWNPYNWYSRKDLKILYVDNKVVDSVIEQVDGEYGKEVPIKVTQQKVHKYLGMTND